MRNLIYFLVFNLAYAHYYDSSSKSYDSAIEVFGADYSGSASESYDEIYDGRLNRISKRLYLNRYRRKRPKVDASIFDSALIHTRRSDASEKKRRKSRVHFWTLSPVDKFRVLACIS